jgi:hypothetical protein
LRLRTSGKTIPLSIALGAACFNVVNGGLNGFYLGSLAPTYPVAWLTDIRFIAGIAIFLLGATVNIWADGKLIALRTNTTDYAIPRGGLFEWVSCPNHLGEIVQWWGFALMCAKPSRLVPEALRALSAPKGRHSLSAVRRSRSFRAAKEALAQGQGYRKMLRMESW